MKYKFRTICGVLVSREVMFLAHPLLWGVVHPDGDSLRELVRNLDRLELPVGLLELGLEEEELTRKDKFILQVEGPVSEPEAIRHHFVTVILDELSEQAEELLVEALFLGRLYETSQVPLEQGDRLPWGQVNDVELLHQLNDNDCERKGSPLEFVHAEMQTHEVQDLHRSSEHVVDVERDRVQHHLVVFLPVDSLLEEEWQRGGLLVESKVVPELHNAFEPEIESVRQNSVIQNCQHFLLDLGDLLDL